MPHPRRMPLLRTVHLAAWLLAAGCTTAPTPKPNAAAPAASSAPMDRRAATALSADIAEARRLSRAHDFAAANAIFERCVARYPADADLRYAYGNSLDLEADLSSDSGAAMALRRRARRELLEAKRLGSTDPLVDLLLAGLKPDGSPPPEGKLSANPEVNAVMRAAENAYRKGDFAQAAAFHQKALALEPGNYLAALYCGDAYFGAHDYEQAGLWFAKAVAINPDIETAYRYWADALEHLHRFEEATDRYIRAVAAEPYNRMTQERFRQYCQRVGLDPQLTRLPVPTGVEKDGAGKPRINLVVGPDGGAYTMTLGIIYAGSALEFRDKEFAQHFPNEARPRRSLLEEVHALRRVLEQARRSAAEKADAATAAEIERWRPGMDRLAQMDRDGLLEAFALLERADAELAVDFPAYRAAHREELVRYIRVYWCGLN